MKGLGIAFDSGQEQALSSFAESLGCPWTRVSVPSGAHASDSLARAIVEAATGCTHLFAVSCMASKDVMAYVAGLLDCAMVTDVVGILGTDTYERPILAGTVVQTVRVDAPVTVATFRPSGFKSAGLANSGQLELGNLVPSRATVSASPKQAGGRPDLTQARVVVSGGRPLADSATFERLIGGLADQLGGAAGATRAAVDSGIASNELQVGQTGKIVAPDLYIAAGISGSTQHLAGIKDSKLIVAINKDPDAPIFEVADLGIVADLFEAIPEISARLK